MLAFKVTTTGKCLDLGDTSVNFTLANPLFDLQGLPKAFTLPFRVPRTPNNEDMLLHGARFDVAPEDQAIEVMLGGVPFYNGVLSIESVTNEAFELVFKSNGLNLAKTLANDYLDLNFFETHSITQTNTPEYYLRIVSNGGVGTSSMAMLIGGHTYTHTITAPADLYLFRDSINTHFPGAASISGSDLIIDFGAGGINLGFNFTLTNGANHVWLCLDTSTYNRAQAAIDNFIAHLNSNAAAAVTARNHFFPAWKFPNFYDPNDNALFGALDILNFHNGGTFDGSKNTEQNNNHNWDYAFMACVKAFYIITERFESYDQVVNADGVMLDTEVVDRLVLSMAKAIDYVMPDYGFDAPAYATGVPEQMYYNAHALTAYNLRDFMPHITSWQLLQSLMGILGFVILEEGEGFTFLSRNDMMTEVDALDWTDRAEPQFSATKQAEADGFTFEFKDLDTKVAQGQFLKAYKTGNGEKKVSVEIGPCAVVRELTFGPATWIIPYTDRNGDGDDNYKGFLMYYRGMQPNSIGDDYPFATNNIFDVDGVAVGTHTLAWDNGSNDLYNENWETFAEFLTAARKCQKTLRLDIPDLIALKNWRNSRRRIFHNDGILDGYISQVSFTADAHRLGMAKVELMYVN